MIINRLWCMPNKETFKMKPIVHLLNEEMCGDLWVDPFAGNNSPAIIRNDINFDVLNVEYNKDALDFLKMFASNSVDGILFDPPYSVRQVAECYKSIGYKVTNETTRSSFYSNLRNEIARVVQRGGKVISFGWSTVGIGKTRGFSMRRILLLCHGGAHNDTIVTVERKIV